MISEATYAAARQSAARLRRANRGRLVVSGADRASYLNGLLTNDILSLPAGGGCYAAYLTPQGRMIADLFVYNLGDVILLVLPRAVKDSVLSKLDQFIFTEDVQLGDVTDAFADVTVVGPEAASVVSAVVDDLAAEDLRRLPEHGNRRTHVMGQPAIVTRVADTGEPGYDVFVERALIEPLVSAIAAKGVVALDEEAADAVRIEAGVPAFGRDMDADTIPLEAGIESRAISFTKGCYVGQEVIVRVLHRGHGRVARKLTGLVLDGDVVPPPGAAVRDGDRGIGHVTSSAWSPALKRPIALAYLHRDFLAPGTSVSVAGGRGVVTDLPLVEQHAK